MSVKIKRLHEDAVIPRYAHEGDSGFDLVAVEDVLVEPGETVKVPIGLAFEIPRGYELQIRPRSGITSKTKLRVQFGTVDSPYRGEVSVTVDNIGYPSMFINETYMELAFDYDFAPKHIDGGHPTNYDYAQANTYLIRKGDRIAQGVIAPVAHATFEEVDELGETERGTGGFGSSGVRAALDRVAEKNGMALENFVKRGD